MANQNLLGRLAVHYNQLTREQLADAIREQGRRDGTVRLGEILVEKGYLTSGQLEKLLALQKKVAAQQAAKKAVEAHAPVPETPSSVPALTTPEKQSAPEGPEPSSAERTRMHSILAEAAAAGASDVHVHSGAPLRVRIHGELVERGEARIGSAEAEALLRSVLTAEERAILDEHGEIDFAYTLPGTGRFRANVYRQQRGLDGVFRVIPPTPPTLDGLGLPSSLARLTGFHQGMVLLTGPAGCGKSQTMAALIDIINEERSEHILTIEDPIEVLHPAKRCLVNQRQVRNHTDSFARALRAALREDPDVIAIGELRDLETISLALSAAETGHFVLATLHTGSTIRTIDRVIGAFPPDQQAQIRTMLSESLRAVVSQRLVKTADGNGRVPALEVLMINRAVGNLVREAKTFQIRSILQTGAGQGMCLLDGSLAQLVQSNTITQEEARRHCEDRRGFGG